MGIRGDINDSYKALLLKCKDSVCLQLRRLFKRTSGNYIEAHSCIDCHKEPEAISQLNREHLLCYSTQSVIIDVDSLGICSENSLLQSTCTHQSKFIARCFGDIPSLIFAKAKTFPITGNVSPIKIAQISGKVSQVTAERKDSFLPYFKIPGYSSIRMAFSCTPPIEGDSDDQYRYFVIKITDREGHLLQRTEDLFFRYSTMADGYDYNLLSPSFALSITRAAIVQEMDMWERSNFPMQTASYSSADPELSATPNEDNSQNLISQLDGENAEREELFEEFSSNIEDQEHHSVRDEEEQPSDFSSHTAAAEEEEMPMGYSGMKRVVLENILGIATVFRKAVPKYMIPFLCDSHRTLVRRNYSSLWDRKNTISIQESSEQLINRWSLISANVHNEPALCFGHDIISEDIIPLRVTVDIDSVDFVTVASGGIAFAKSKALLLTTWDRNHFQFYATRGMNNNLCSFFAGTSDAYPGPYFLKGTVLDRRRRKYSKPHGELAPEQPNDPIQLIIIHMQSCLTMHPLKVSAMFSRQKVRETSAGEMSLVKLFRIHVNNGSEEPWKPRYFLCQFLWYLETELLIFCICISTVRSDDMSLGTRMPCCVFPHPNMDDCHHKTRGHLSGFREGFILGYGELTVGLLFRARFLRALEQLTMLDQSLQNQNFKDIKKYELPEDLYHLCCSQEVLNCLKSPIGDKKCLIFFKKMWRKDRKLNNILHISSDPSRRMERALPNSESNRLALEKGAMCLEDLLILSHVVYRGTVHGTKTTCHDSRSVAELQERLGKEINPAGFQDGIIDVAYTLRCPRGMNFTLLPRVDAAFDRDFIPSFCDMTVKELNAYATTMSGYPSCAGFSTGNGNVGDERSCMDPEGIRRIKVYTTKWSSDSIRGNTIYDPCSMTDTLDPTKLMLHTWKLHGAASTTSQSDAENVFAKIWKNFRIIEHNIEHREHKLCTPQNATGVRIELTCRYDEDMEAFKVPYKTLEIQEKRDSYERDTLLAEIEANPGKWPWWVLVPVFGVPIETESGDISIESLPILTCKEKTIEEWTLLLEKTMVSLSLEILQDSVSLASRNGLQLNREPHPFLNAIYEEMDTSLFWQLISNICQGLLIAAKSQLDSEMVHITRREIVLPPFPAITTGTILSWGYNGIPKIVLSRLAYSGKFSEVFSAAGHIEGTLGHMSQNNVRRMMIRDDEISPRSLCMRNVIRNPKYFESITGDLVNVSREDNSVSTLWKVAQLRLRNSFRASTATDQALGLQICPPSRMTKEISAVAIIFAALHVMDIFHFLKELAQGDVTGCDQAKIPFSNTEIDLYGDWVLDAHKTLVREREWMREARIDFGKDNLEQEILALQGCFGRDLSFQRAESDSIPGNIYVAHLIDSAKSYGSSFNKLTKRTTKRSKRFEWISIAWLRVVLDFVAQEAKQWEMKYGTQHRLSREMEDRFGFHLQKALILHGFDKLCPVLQRPLFTDGSLDSMKVLQEPPSFATLSEVCDAKIPISEFGELPSLSQNIRIPLDQRKALYHTYLADLRDIKIILKRRAKTEKGSHQYKEMTAKFVELQTKRWNLHNHQTLLKLVLQAELNKPQFSHLDERTVAWIYTIFNRMCNIRRRVGDEGMACYASSTGTLISIRDRANANLEKEEEIFPKLCCFSKPWGSGLYPNPMDLEDTGVQNRNTRVKAAAPFLRASELFFKLKGENRKCFKLPRGQDRFSDFQDMLVVDIENNYPRDQKPLTSRAQWRLSSDLVLIPRILARLRNPIREK